MTPDEWSDEVYEATGMVVTREHARAIGEMVAARVEEACAECERLRAALSGLLGAVDRLGAALASGEDEQWVHAHTIRAAGVARAALGEDRT